MGDNPALLRMPGPEHDGSYPVAATRGADRDGSARGPVARPHSIDALDRQIVERLQENGRQSFRKIAAELDVAEGTVRARYARLCGDNILQIIGVTNPLGLGFDAIAMIGVKTSGSPGPVADGVATWREASYVVITTGQFDLLVEVVCADRHELLEVTGRLRELDGVVSTETFLYLELCKQLYNWGARGKESAASTRPDRAAAQSQARTTRG
jgi:Lrp/AsnC family transcriptional regulator for asnA, asnC and gidA